MKRVTILTIFLLSLILIPGNSFGISTKDTRMLTQPAISANNIAFIYAEDLWIANSDGSQPRRLTVDEGIESDPCFSPDGLKMAYTPLSPAYTQWKNYRGGMVSNILIYTFPDYSVVKIPQPKEGCNDTDPMWIGSKIYFKSDRNGEFNLFSYDILTTGIKQLTSFTDFPVIKTSCGSGKIILEQSGYLHTYDINSSLINRLTIGIAADLLELRPRFVKGNSYIRRVDISPTGVRVAFDFRGDIVTVPNVAIWTKDGFVVENVGVAPDIEVEQLPADVIKGKDPQLEKAIELALKELAESPPEEPVRPPYPVRVRK